MNTSYLKYHNHALAMIHKAMRIEPRLYYQTQFPNEVIVHAKALWLNVCCCFHEDHNPSLSINLLHGYCRCFGCGVHCRSIIGFHSKRYHLSFLNAAKILGGSENDCLSI